MASFDSMVSIKAKPMLKETVETKKVRMMNSMKVDKVSKVERVKLETSIADKKFGNANFVETECRSAQKCLAVEKATKEEKQAFFASPKLGAVVFCKDATRDKLRKIFSDALCKVSGEVGETLRDQANKYDPFRVAVSLETAMFKKWGRHNWVHKFKYRSIMFNIKDPKNPDFRRKVLLGQVKPEMVLKMTPEEMASEERQQQYAQIKGKALFECERGNGPQATTDMFKCGRCGKNSCTYRQLQTRSADEPMTTFVMCVACGHQWKFC